MDALEGDDEGIGQLKKHALHLECHVEAVEDAFFFFEKIVSYTLRPKPCADPHTHTGAYVISASLFIYSFILYIHAAYMHVHCVPLGIHTTRAFH